MNQMTMVTTSPSRRVPSTMPDMEMELITLCPCEHNHHPIEGISPISRVIAAEKYQFQYRSKDAFCFNESNYAVTEEIKAVELVDTINEGAADEPLNELRSKVS
jgi:hypothetical protein